MSTETFRRIKSSIVMLVSGPLISAIIVALAGVANQPVFADFIKKLGLGSLGTTVALTVVYQITAYLLNKYSDNKAVSNGMTATATQNEAEIAHI